MPHLGLLADAGASLREQGFVAVSLQESLRREPERLQPHYHSYFQLNLIHGPCTVMHDFREQEVDGDHLLFVSPGEVHTMRTTPQLDGTTISFTREFFEGRETSTGFLLELPVFYVSEGFPWMALPPADVPVLRYLFQQLQIEYDRSQAGAAEAIRALLRLILVRSARIRTLVYPVSKSRHQSTTLVRYFQLEVERHYRTWAQLSPYARALGVTANHLNDVVAEVTGQPAGEHLRQRKLLEAKRLLLHSELTAAEIAYELGFKDPSYFGRFFRRYESCSPSRFREQIREKYHFGTQ